MIIAVWGNAGSGKSTLAIKLANSFVRLKKDVVLVDTSFIAPQVNIWYPRLDIKAENSLAVLLDNNITSNETLVAKVNLVGNNLGVVGYAKNYSTNIIPNRSDTVSDFLSFLPQICDIAIIDCQAAAINDVLSYIALEDYADERIIALTPDLRGLSWYDTNVRMMEENWKNNDKSIIKAFNQTQITAPVVDIEDAIGSVQYYLPYDRDIHKEMLNGTLGGEGHRKYSRKYTRVVDTIAGDLLKRSTFQEV